ncbi:MAG: HAD family hydrolase [Candidatus Velthaea sp.]
MAAVALFDIDGTLIDSNGAHAAAWHDALAEAGYDVPVERIRPLIGMGGDRILPEIDPGLNDEDGAGKAIAERRKAIFLERYLAGIQPTTGARDLLEALRRRGLRCIIASSAKRAELDKLLARGELGPLIDDASTSDDASSSKPAPDIVTAALAKAKVDARDAVLIGDTRYDVEAAQRAGVVAIGLLCGGSDAASLSGAAAVYADPAALLAALEESPLAA